MGPHIRAVVVADGEIDLDAVRRALQPEDGETVLAIGADGGARHLESSGRLPDLVCGDADSLSTDDLDRYRGQGTPVELHAADKDESDTELCLRAALDRGATRLVLLGAVGGSRLEHAVANELLLASAWLDGIDARIIHAGSSMWRVGTVDGPGAAELLGARGDYISLLPMDDPVTGTSTEGLRYPLCDEPLALGSTRGLSNELVKQDGYVTTQRGRLLVIHTPRTTGAADHHRGQVQ